MALAITDQYQPKYVAGWLKLAQQPTSRLSKAVSVRNGSTGIITYRDQIKPIDAVSLGAPTANRLGTTPTSEIETEIRALIPEKFHIVKQFDEFDAGFLASQSLPTSDVFQQMRGGFNRKVDDIIIAAITSSTSKTGVGGQTDTPLGAAQQLDIQLGGSSVDTQLNLDKVLAAVELLAKNEAFGQDLEEGGEEGFIVLSAEEITALFKEARALQHEFMQDVTDLYRNRVSHLLGLNVIRSERLAVATSVRTCAAFVKSGVALDIWKDPTFKLSVRDDLNEALQMRGTSACGATRLEEVKVVEIPTKVGATYNGA